MEIQSWTNHLNLLRDRIKSRQRRQEAMDPNQLSPMQRLLLQLADEYTPAVDAHWANPNPTSVGEALDRLAAEIIAQTAATEIS